MMKTDALRAPLCLRAVLGLAMIAGLAPSVAQAAQSASQTWLFENRSYFDPAVAEIHAPDVTATVFAQGSQLQYSTKPGRRRAWTISLGKEVPVVGRDGTSRAGAACVPDVGPPKAGCTGWGIWFAIDFHMLEDFRDNSNPIVDTDYRFGGMVKYQHAFSATRSFSLRGYYGHESTHLGDEFSLAAQRNLNVTDFQRINVSYQYWEYGISYDYAHMKPDGSANLFKFRHLGSILDPFTSWKQGYYSTDPLEVNGHTVTPSHNRYEPTLEFEWRNQSLHLSKFETLPAGTKVPTSWWRPYVSVDSRYRTIYNYAKTDPNAPEQRQWSTNVVAGFYRLRQELKRGEPDFFGRVYYGVNPYGQLRNQRGYFLFGIGVHVFV